MTYPGWNPGTEKEFEVKSKEIWKNYRRQWTIMY